MVHHTGCLTLKNFGVPQRRRRVFVVGHLGDWRPSAEVLFESESLSWDSDKSRKKRKDSTSIPKGSTRVQGKGVATPLLHQDHIDALCARDYKGLNSDSLDKKAIVEMFENHPQDSRVKEMGDTCQTVTSTWGAGGGNIPFVLNKNYYDVIQEVAVRKYDVDIDGLQQLLKKHKNMSIKDIAEKIGVKKTTAEHWFRTDKFFAIPEPEVWPVLKELLKITDDSFDKSIMTIEYKDGKYDQSNRIHNGQKPSPTLTRTSTGNDLFALAENTIGRQPLNGGNGDGYTERTPMYTLNATGVHGVSNNMAVRKLTPVECERLQGFPDNYTNIKENCPDGHRYKAMGNSMAVPVMRWIGERINNYKEENYAV